MMQLIWTVLSSLLAFMILQRMNIVAFTTRSTRPSNVMTMSQQVRSATMLPLLPQLKSQFRVVLGSASPRRQELLRLMGFNEFDVVVSNFAEDLDRSIFASASDYCAATAYKKVQAVAQSLASPVNDGGISGSNGGVQKTLIIGADTIVEIDGMVLEKPVDDADSRRMLRSLSGREQLVHTAVIGFCNCNTLTDSESAVAGSFPYDFSFVETSRVRFAELSDADIDAYVATGEGRDKAGSYGIQGVGGQLVQSISGCYFNVMGLPIHRLSQHIAQLFAAESS